MEIDDIFELYGYYLHKILNKMNEHLAYLALGIYLDSYRFVLWKRFLPPQY